MAEQELPIRLRPDTSEAADSSGRDTQGPASVTNPVQSEGNTASVPADHVRSTPSPVPPRGPLPLRIRDQIVLAVISALALFFMVVYCVRTSRWGMQPIELERQPEHVLDYKIELNTATWVEWSQLPGIGPVLSQRIVEERERNGPFRNVDDLHRVKGIGPKKIDAVRPFVKFERTERAAPTESSDER